MVIQASVLLQPYTEKKITYHYKMSAVAGLIILLVLVGIAIYAVQYQKAEEAKEEKRREEMGPIKREALEAGDKAKEGGGGATYSDYFLTGGVKTTLCKVDSDGYVKCEMREGIPETQLSDKETAEEGAGHGSYVGAVTGSIIGFMVAGPVGAAVGAGVGAGVGAASGAGIGWAVAAGQEGEDNKPFAGQVTLNHKFRIDNAGVGHGGLYTIQNIGTEKFCQFEVSNNKLSCTLNTKEEALIDSNNAKFAIIYKGEITPEVDEDGNLKELCTLDGVCIENNKDAEDVMGEQDIEGKPKLGEDVHLYMYEIAVKKPGSTMEGVYQYCQEADNGTIPCNEATATEKTIFNLVYYDSDSEFKAMTQTE